MNFKPIVIYLLLIAFGLLSCNNKEQQLAETAQRLEQQNAVANSAIRLMCSDLNKIIFDDYTERYEYLKQPIKSFHSNAERFSDQISSAGTTVGNAHPAVLYNYYQAWLQDYKFLRKQITDSFRNLKFDAGINGFLDLDEKAFTQKYLSGKDSASSKLQLLFLQADAILNEKFLIETTICAVASSGSYFDPTMAMGTTDKAIYKRGERLTLTTLIVKYISVNVKYGMVNGKRVEAHDGLFRYSKKITEKPGAHELRFNLIVKRNGKLESYPSVAKYVVE